MAKALSVVMLGASGATGGETLKALLAMPEVTRITLLGRREVALPDGAAARVTQRVVDVGSPTLMQTSSMVTMRRSARSASVSRQR